MRTNVLVVLAIVGLSLAGCAGETSEEAGTTSSTDSALNHERCEATAERIETKVLIELGVRAWQEGWNDGAKAEGAKGLADAQSLFLEKCRAAGNPLQQADIGFVFKNRCKAVCGQMGTGHTSPWTPERGGWSAWGRHCKDECR